MAIKSTNAGRVKFYIEAKGFGFITDTKDEKDYFFHYTGTLDRVKKDDLVEYDLEEGQRGLKAVNVHRVKDGK